VSTESIPDAVTLLKGILSIYHHTSYNKCDGCVCGDNELNWCIYIILLVAPFLLENLNEYSVKKNITFLETTDSPRHDALILASHTKSMLATHSD
jgi:hypothetical protein